MATEKEMFINIYLKNIKREGAKELLEWLEGTDFFSAPADTKHPKEKGLVRHSLNVYRLFRAECVQWCRAFTGLDEKLSPDLEETIALCALLHDVAKCNSFKKAQKNAKNEQTGLWEKVSYYIEDDQFPYGEYGPKSVWLIERYVKLSESESLTIRWHEALPSDKSTADIVFKKCPYALLLHVAHTKARFIYDIK